MYERKMNRHIPRLVATTLFAVIPALVSCAPRGAARPQSRPTQTSAPSQAGASTASTAPPGASASTARRPRPYRQVITERAITDTGGITTHRVDDRWFFEVPESLVGR